MMAEKQQRWREGIAIVGMSARFPGCRNVGEYWEKISAGESLLTAATDEEMRAAGVEPGSAEAMHFVRQGTYLEDAESFDPKFFEMTRRDAETIDPQQRIFLECAYEALEHAGLRGDGERVGVFGGMTMNTYLMQLFGNPEMLAAAGLYQMMLGNDKDYLSTRVSYKLNLRGPSVVVQSACSTSLAAVHLACQSLLMEECDSALAGGVSVLFPQVAGYPYVPGMILSPDGFCRAFDEGAHGTVPGKGVGLVVLKRLSDAEAAGDTIYAVIAGSGLNNDGSSKVGFTAPSVAGQVEVIKAAHEAAGITGERVGFVEAHGTGTELGDPIEVAALAEAFGARPQDAARCVLGSVKANMGHADVAAGVAGLIKAALVVRSGFIPGTVHFQRANPALGLEQTPFRVSAEPVDWPVEVSERWAGVNSFGMGGTNVHVCLRGVPVKKTDSKPGPNGPWIFPLSAKTAGALETSVRRLGKFVEGERDLSLAAAAATLQTGRRVYGFRRAVVAGDKDELAAELNAAARKLEKSGQTENAQGRAKAAFLFPGQGQQFHGMAAGLYARDARFRNLIDRGVAILPEQLGRELLQTISGVGSEEAGAMTTSLAQPLLFLVEFALASRWMEMGVVPAMLVGHSLGELTAAAVAGVFSFEDGLRLAARRGELMQQTPEGAMLAVSLAVQDASAYLSSDLWIGAENAPKLTVLSGSVGAVEEAEQKLKVARVGSVRLKNDRAFHTPHMAEAASLFHDTVAAVERHAPQLPWLSNVSGTWITAEEATSPQYWADQMTARVRFSENAAILAQAAKQSGVFLLEAGPGDALSTLVRQQDRTGISASMMASSLGSPNRRGDDFQAFLEAAAQFWERGGELHWEKAPGSPDAELKADRRVRRVALPTYPFERERYFVEATHPVLGSGSASRTPEVTLKSLVKRADVASWFYAPTWQRTAPAGLALPKRPEPVAGSTWLVIEDDSGLGAQLAEGLEAAGAQVLQLPAGTGSREQFELFWTANRELTSAGPIGLIGCWTGWSSKGQASRNRASKNQAPENQGGSKPGEVFATPYESLLLLLQTAQIARVRFAQMDFVIDQLVEVQGEGVEDSSRAVLEGMARVLPAEYSGLPMRVIDPGLVNLGPVNSGPVAESVSAEWIARILAEIGTVATAGLTVALRGETRWQQVWLPMRLEGGGTSRLRQGGCYVITGGMGGIGQVMAKHLLGKYGAKVALIGRTVLPIRERWEEWLTEQGPQDPVSRRIQRAKELEQLGGEIMLLTADVSDRAAMERAWTSIEERFGMVHGVIHAAGLPGGARVAAQDLASADEVLRPKVQGSQILAELLAGRDLASRSLDRSNGAHRADFLLFCSSISAAVPVPGASAYAAANAFQDRFAVWCRQHLGVPALAINFDAWQEVGMAAERVVDAEFEKDKLERLELGISPEEGIEVIERALIWNDPQVLVSTVDFATILKLASPGQDRNLGSLSETVLNHELSGTSSHDRFSESASEHTAETQAVISIWRELLGTERIEPGDNFFELGGHSLLGTMVLARIRGNFGVDLGIRAIFEAPTPETLGARIRQAAPVEQGAEPVGASVGSVGTVGTVGTVGSIGAIGAIGTIGLIEREEFEI